MAPRGHADRDAGEREALAVTALETVELDRRFHGGEAYAEPVPRLVGINHVVLEVTDLEEALEFYGRVFDFELRGRVRGMAFIDMGDQFLVLAESAQPERPDRERHFGLVVDDRAAVRERLDEIGRDLGAERHRSAAGDRPLAQRPRLPRPVGEPRPGGRVRLGAVHEDRERAARDGARRPREVRRRPRGAA